MVRPILALNALVLALVFAAVPARSQQPLQYTTGRVPPTLGQFQALQAAQQVAHAAAVVPLADATEKKWDSRTKGWIPDIKNQGNCGSCWDFSGTELVEVAYIKAKLLPKDKANFSEQYTLDCYENGGCNGDDNTTVLKHAKRTGLILTTDYGPYHAREGRCQSGGKKLFKIDDWAFADGDAGYEQIGSTQKIKNAIKAYGIVGCAIAADNAFMNVRPGQVFRGNSRSINHDVALVGWDDTLVEGKTVWILRNSWGTGWCDGGYCLIQEGANRVGTEPVVAIMKHAEPDPEPGPEPVPPGPNPPKKPHDLTLIGIGVVIGIIIAVVIPFFARRVSIKWTPSN